MWRKLLWDVVKNYQFLADKNLNYEKEIEHLIFQQKILKEKLIKAFREILIKKGQ